MYHFMKDSFLEFPWQIIPHFYGLVRKSCLHNMKEICVRHATSSTSIKKSFSQCSQQPFQPYILHPIQASEAGYWAFFFFLFFSNQFPNNYSFSMMSSETLIPYSPLTQCQSVEISFPLMKKSISHLMF